MIDGYLEFQDIGVSDKELCLGVYENKGENYDFKSTGKSVDDD